MVFNTLIVIASLGIIVPIFGITGLGILKFIKSKRNRRR